MDDFEPTDYHFEQRFKLEKKWYREGQSAYYDGREMNTNPYSVGSIPYNEWFSGYTDGPCGREY